MEFITCLLRNIANMAFMLMDSVVLILLIKTVHDRWHFSWLGPLANAIEPTAKTIITSFSGQLSKLTSKTYADRTLILLLVFCLWVLRSLVITLLA